MTSLLQDLDGLAPEFVAIRRDIHQHPELGFQEHRTAELVAGLLEQWGYQVERGLGGTGVVGQLRRGAGVRRLGIRADLDALPIEEQSGRSYASRVAGVMHACGHDGHTAMLLAAARYLSEKGRFSGTLNVIFQPAEEGLGGASRMIAEGLFEKYPCDAVYAAHNAPGLPQGVLAFRDGPTMASSDRVLIRLEGVGGHGAIPHKAVDPVVAAASIVMALQTIVSRNVDPSQLAVVTVGVLKAGTANNVIPAEASMELTVRALDPEVRATLERRIHALVTAQAESFGVRAHIDYQRGYAVLVNSREETDFARRVAVDLVGPEKVILNGPPVSGSEDFAFMLEQRPGSYFFIGNGIGEGGSICEVHNPRYDFNDENIGVGGAFWVSLAERFLANSDPGVR
jgi:hippurate hydrolase